MTALWIYLAIGVVFTTVVLVCDAKSTKTPTASWNVGTFVFGCIILTILWPFWLLGTLEGL